MSLVVDCLPDCQPSAPPTSPLKNLALHCTCTCSTCHCNSKIIQGALDCINTADQIVHQSAIPLNASSLRSCCDPPTHPLSATKDGQPKILRSRVVRVFLLDTNFVSILSPFEQSTAPEESAKKPFFVERETHSQEFYFTN